VRFIDARSGDDLRVGSQIRYPDGEGYDVVGLTASWLRAAAVVKELPTGQVRVVPLQVRYLHPAFLLQAVAFFPS
jgi:hypothetical protein